MEYSDLCNLTAFYLHSRIVSFNNFRTLDIVNDQIINRINDVIVYGPYTSNR